MSDHKHVFDSEAGMHRISALGVYLKCRHCDTVSLYNPIVRLDDLNDDEQRLAIQALKNWREMWGSAEFDCGPTDYAYMREQSIKALRELALIATPNEPLHCFIKGIPGYLLPSLPEGHIWMNPLTWVRLSNGFSSDQKMMSQSKESAE